MTNNIIPYRTIEEYNKKYRNRRERLLIYTKKEVEEFDRKNSTNKHLLKGRKWWLIDDTYYEAPRAFTFTWFRNLRAGIQIATCIVAIGAVASAITVPIVLDAIENSRIKVEEMYIYGEAIIETNTSEKLSLFLYPLNSYAKTATWSIENVDPSDKEVHATIDQNGQITGISKGKIKVIAKANDRKGVVKEFMMDVIDPITPSKIQFTFSTYEHPEIPESFENADFARAFAPFSKEERDKIEAVKIPDYVDANGNPSSKEKGGLPVERLYTESPYNGAFNNCVNLKYVYLPSTLTDIDPYSFNKCSSLKSVTIPNSVKTIDDHAFYLSGLSSVVISPLTSLERLNDFAFSMTNLNQIDIFSNVKKIGDMCFNKTESLKTVNIKEDSKLESIGTGAFEDCENLSSIYIPLGVKTINNHSFFNCQRLSTVTINDDSQIESIGSSAFQDCFSLSSFKITNSVKTIGEAAFSGCSTLPSVHLHDNVKSIGKNCYNGCENLSSLTFSANNKIEAIPYGAFNGCKKLDNITTFPDTIKNFSDFAFNGCESLSSIAVPPLVTNIGDSCFNGDKNLSSITFNGSKVENIGGNAFKDCVKLTSILIPHTVKGLGAGAFSGSGIKNISFEGDLGLTFMGNQCFKDCPNLESLTIPSGVTYLGSNFITGSPNVNSVTFKDTEGTWRTSDNLSYKPGTPEENAAELKKNPNGEWIKNTIYIHNPTGVNTVKVNERLTVTANTEESGDEWVSSDEDKVELLSTGSEDRSCQITGKEAGEVYIGFKDMAGECGVIKITVVDE